MIERSENKSLHDQRSWRTPEEFAIYRQTGQLQMKEMRQVQHHQGKGMKQRWDPCKNLVQHPTEEAREKESGSVIGRNKEIPRNCWNLVSSYQNNPVLVGDAGVGKTVVEGVWHKLCEQGCWLLSRTKKSSRCDISGLEAGTANDSFEESIQIWSKKSSCRNVIPLLMKSIKSLVQVAQVMVKDLRSYGCNHQTCSFAGNWQSLGQQTQDEYRNTILKNAK